MPKQIPIPTDFRCRDPKLFINYELKRLKKELRCSFGFTDIRVTDKLERKIKTLESYGY